MELVRRPLFQSDMVQVAYVRACPDSDRCGDVEQQSTNVLVLPLAGVFAKHDGPRRQALGTPNHAIWIAADRPYRISYPGGRGDECLTLRFANASLARVWPRAPQLLRSAALSSPQILLAPDAMIARSLLWRRLQRGGSDPLYVEETALALLGTALAGAGDTAGAPRRLGGARRRPIARAAEAIAADPARGWHLGELAGIACVSPYHLAHAFRRDLGTSVYRYVLRARLALALAAVLDSDRPLTAVALDAGFASHSHFTARFRALFGVTPAALRRAARAPDAGRLRKIVTADRPAAG